VRFEARSALGILDPFLVQSHCQPGYAIDNLIAVPCRQHVQD
jgi:hypothetical protein